MSNTNLFKWGATPFRFENMWLFHSDFKDNLGCWWNEYWFEGWEGQKLMKKFQFVKSKLKELNKVSFGDLKEKKKNILLDIVGLDENEQGIFNPELATKKTLKIGRASCRERV